MPNTKEVKKCEAIRQAKGPYIFQQGTQCSRQATVEVNGKHYCKQHALALHGIKV